MSLANESKPGVSAAIVDLLRTQGTLTTPSLDVQVIFNCQDRIPCSTEIVKDSE